MERGFGMAEVKEKRDDVSVDGLARMLRDGRITRRGFLAGAAGVVGSMVAAEVCWRASKERRRRRRIW